MVEEGEERGRGEVLEVQFVCVLVTHSEQPSSCSTISQNASRGERVQER